MFCVDKNNINTKIEAKNPQKYDLC